VIAHWDDVEGEARLRAHLGGTWFDLGHAAGTVTAGVKRVRLPSGSWSTPAHVHGRNEEIVYVLAGSGLSWQDGDNYEVGAGDCLVHRVADAAHTLLGGEEGLDVLVFGTRHWDEAPTLPRAQSVWLGEGWVVLAGEEDHPWTRDAAAGPPELPEQPSPRPASIVNVDDVETFWDDNPRGFGGAWRNLGDAAGSVRTGLKHQWIEPGNVNCPLHCHSAEEEIFVLLQGDGVLELVPTPTGWQQEEQHIPVRAGHVVSRPAGTRLAHAFRAGDAGLTLLAYGTRDVRDVAYYPRSNKLYFRGAGVIVRAEPLDYWDGEA
jgi:uncharacterized cupin superfamily protein